jgi:hypothetical protein
MAQEKYDPYRKLDQKVANWFIGVIGGMVKNPQAACFSRRRAGLDLEISITVASEDRAVFTEEVCLALAQLVKVTTGVLHPVVYLEGAPHQQAIESLAYAERQV